MSPEDITAANWVQAMEDMPCEPSSLTSSIRENLDQPTQHVLRTMRDRAPSLPVELRPCSCGECKCGRKANNA